MKRELHTINEGRFMIADGIGIPHIIPQGVEAEGYPVIIFPKDANKVVAGHHYCFMPPYLTRVAKYKCDGVTYRVAHADGLVDNDCNEGGFVDGILHTSSGEKPDSSVGARLGGDGLAALQQLKNKLGG